MQDLARGEGGDISILLLLLLLLLLFSSWTEAFKAVEEEAVAAAKKRDRFVVAERIVVNSAGDADADAVADDASKVSMTRGLLPLETCVLYFLCCDFTEMMDLMMMLSVFCMAVDGCCN
jgi:hypothetical protein